MALINKNTVNAQFFKGHKVIFAALVIEPFQPRFQRFSGAFQLLDGISLCFRCLCFFDAKHDLVDLLLQNSRLTFC